MITIFILGILSFFSPCIIAIIPGYLGYINNSKLIYSILFSFGFITAYSFISIPIYYILSTSNISYLNYISGSIIILISATKIYNLLNNNNKHIIIKFNNKLYNNILNKLYLLSKHLSPLSAYLAGMATSLGSLSCVLPNSIAINAVNNHYSIINIILYALGFALPFFTIAYIMDNIIIKHIIKKYTKYIYLGTLILMLIFGILIILKINIQQLLQII